MTKYRVRNKYKKSVDEIQTFVCDDFPGVSIDVTTNYRWGTWIVEDPVLDTYEETINAETEDHGPFSVFDLECMFERDLEFEELEDACSEDYEVDFSDVEHQGFFEDFEESVEEEGIWETLDKFSFYELDYEYIIPSPVILEKIDE